MNAIAQPFALAVDEPNALSAREQQSLARSLALLRRQHVDRGRAQTTFERAAFHRCVAYDHEAGELAVYLLEASRRRGG